MMALQLHAASIPNPAAGHCALFPAAGQRLAVLDAVRFAIRMPGMLLAASRAHPGENMERIDKTFEIDCPIRTVYNQWTQFEDFPRFMDGVKEVRQIDDTHLHWRASIGGKDKEWDAEITEQVPDQRIAWRSTSGAPNAGTVRFEPLAQDRTRVMLSMEYEPQGMVEKAGDAIGVVSHKVENAVEKFKELVEERGAETGEWRGEVQGGRKVERPGAQPDSGSGGPAHGPGGTPRMPGSRKRQ
jgi:uncharacterized membrane protein